MEGAKKQTNMEMCKNLFTSLMLAAIHVTLIKNVFFSGKQEEQACRMENRGVSRWFKNK